MPPTIVEPVEPAMPMMKRATSIVWRFCASAQGMIKTRGEGIGEDQPPGYGMLRIQE